MNRLLLFNVLWLACSTTNLAENDSDEDSILTVEGDQDLLTHLRKPNTLGPSVWAAGVHCLHEVSKTYFTGGHASRVSAPNLIITQALNISTPAAQIQEQYLRLINRIISKEVSMYNSNFSRRAHQLRVVADGPSFNPSDPEIEIRLADYYILVGDNVDRLHILIMHYLRRMSSWNPGAKFLILFHNAENRNRAHETALAIFGNMLSGTFVTRVIVMYAVSPTIYHLFAMRYYTPLSCRTLRADKFGICNNGNLHPEAATIHKQVHDMFDVLHPQNCTFVLCATVLAPFVEHNCEEGLEIKMINFFSKQLNFQLNITCTHENRGVLLESGSWSGLLGKLQNRTCDLLAGGFFPDEELAIKFWTSDVYFENSYTWYIKKAQRRPAWLALYSIFNNTTWFCLFGALFSSWIFWYFLVKVEKEGPKGISLVGLYNMAVSISVAVPYTPIRTASRIFFLVIAVYGLNVAALFTTNLISVFSDPGLMHQISTLAEVVEAGIQFGGIQEMRDWFENEYDEWIFRLYNDSADFKPNTKNLKAVSVGKRVLLSNRLYVLQNIVSSELYGFPENVLSSYAQMIMKPGFPFMDEFNTLIHHLRDFGHSDYVMKSFIYNNTYIDHIAKKRPKFEDNAIVLTPAHLEGPFQLLILGELLGLLVFFGELFTYHILKPYLQKRKNNTKIKN